MITFTDEQNADFKQVYLDCLYCRTELIQFNYPHEHDAEDYAIGEHLDRCKLILVEFLLDRIPGIADEQNVSLNNEQLNELIGDRSKYILKLVSPDIAKFVEEIRVIYIS